MIKDYISFYITSCEQGKKKAFLDGEFLRFYGESFCNGHLRTNNRNGLKQDGLKLE